MFDRLSKYVVYFHVWLVQIILSLWVLSQKFQLIFYPLSWKLQNAAILLPTNGIVNKELKIAENRYMLLESA